MSRAADILQQYLAATNTHDFDEVEPLLMPEAVYFFGDATCVGRDAVRAYFERTWEQIPDERYWADDLEWVADGEDCAVAVYTYNWSGTVGGAAASGSGRATNVFVRTSGRWRLSHEHLSASPRQ